MRIGHIPIRHVHVAFALLTTGGGSALLHASKALNAIKEKLTNFDQKIGVQIIQVCGLAGGGVIALVCLNLMAVKGVHA